MQASDQPTVEPDSSVYSAVVAVPTLIPRVVLHSLTRIIIEGIPSQLKGSRDTDRFSIA